jgi:hypothetical protein
MRDLATELPWERALEPEARIVWSGPRLVGRSRTTVQQLRF